MAVPGTIAVLDVGKSNVKLSACDADGHVLETLTTPNPVLDGPHWRYHDLPSLNRWVFAGLRDLGSRHPLGHFVASGHGSGGVLVGDDPDFGGDGTVLPMIDYEQPLPDGLAEAYEPICGDFLDRGSAVMMAATHTARQMFWAQRARPADVARARWCLGIPQYWAWRLSGTAVSEATILGAQSHLWNVAHARWSPIVEKMGWGRLMPPFAPAHADLGPVRSALVEQGVPAMRVHAGVHDSSANFHRYKAAGLSGLCVISTGTWIVALADRLDISRLDERRGMTCNADVGGAPVGGALTMGGREYSAVAKGSPRIPADAGILARLVAQGTMTLPTFGTNDGQFPGTAGRGRIVGPAPQTEAERHALAVLYVALLTVECGNRLDPDRPWVLDGTFLRDPAFAALVAAIRPGRLTQVNAEGYGIAAGAAALCHPDRVMPPPTLTIPEPIRGLPDLGAYAQRWRALAEEMTQ